MTKVIPFKISKEDYYDRAYAAFEKNEAEDAIANLKKALAEDENYTEASVLLSRAYAGIGASDIAASVLYDALSKRPGDAQESNLFYALAMCYADLGEFEVAEYYLENSDEGLGDFEFPEDFDESDEEIHDRLHLSYPVDEAYSERLIKKAYELMGEHKFDEVVKTLELIDQNSESAAGANHMKLVCMMVKGDLDGTIRVSREMLAKNDSLPTRCTLATALLMEDKKDEAKEVIANMLQKEYTAADDVLVMLPVLINADEHEAVEKYTALLCGRSLQMNIMIWRSQALYNLSRRDEARAAMLQVKRIFGDYSPAQFYLDLYKTQPQSVEYSYGLPVSEKMNRCAYIDECLKLDDVDFARAFDSDEGLEEALDWLFDEANTPFIITVFNKLVRIQTDGVRAFLRHRLIANDLSFEIMRCILGALLNGGYSIECDVVAQYRYKRVNLRLPSAFYSLPKVLRKAVGFAVCDVIFTDEEPNTYLESLRLLVESIVKLDENGKPVYSRAKAERIAMCRSEATLVGVLLSRVYEDDDEDPRESAIERYGLNARTFDKYYKILFGDEDGKQ